MKKIFSALVLACFSWQLMHAQAANEIILYADANFGGQSVTVTVGTYPDIAALGFPYNTASSIKVGSGVVAVLHSCVDFGGNYKNGFRAYETNDSDFSNDFWPQGQNCGGTTANNNVNALWVMNKNCVPGPDEVSFFDNPNFAGGCVTVPAGSYISPVLAGMPNDWAGSLKVGSNVSVKIWVADFQGSSVSYNPGSSVANLGIGNNNMSSLIVDGCPNDPNKLEPGFCGCGMPETDTDGDNLPDCVDPDDDNDGISDVDEIACGSNPLNAASTCEVCDGIDNDLDGITDEGFANTDGDNMADCVDPDDDNDGISDICDTAPLVNNYVYAGIGPNFPSQWICSGSGNNVKLKVCHNGNTLCISSNAVNSHLSHGDYLGECSCNGAQNIMAPGNSGHAFETTAHIDVYPNPASDKVNIEFTGLEGNVSVTILDHLGRTVYATQLEQGTNSLQLDLGKNTYRNGIYLVSVVANGESLTKRLVIAR